MGHIAIHIHGSLQQQSTSYFNILAKSEWNYASKLYSLWIDTLTSCHLAPEYEFSFKHFEPPPPCVKSFTNSVRDLLVIASESVCCSSPRYFIIHSNFEKYRAEMTQHMLKCNRAARLSAPDCSWIQKLCDKLDSVIVVTFNISH